MLNQSKKAKTAKFKKHSYIATGCICCPLLLAFISVFFEQFELFRVFVYLCLIFCLIMLPFMSQSRKIEVVERIKSIDVSKQLGLKDVFSQDFPYNFLKKHGLRMTLKINMIIVALSGVGVALVLTIIFQSIIGFTGPWWLMLTFFLGYFVGYFVVAYFQLKSALKVALVAISSVASCNFVPQVNVQTVNGTINFCSKCGAPVLSGANFCVHCGKQL